MIAVSTQKTSVEGKGQKGTQHGYASWYVLSSPRLLNWKLMYILLRDFVWDDLTMKIKSSSSLEDFLWAKES